MAYEYYGGYSDYSSDYGYTNEEYGNEYSTYSTYDDTPIIETLKSYFNKFANVFQDVKFEDIPISSKSISNCYKMYYPDTYKKMMNANLFHYLHLWGIRVSSCDTSLPDDLVGGMRINNFNFLETIVSKASTEPSPKYLLQLYDREARAKGGTAFVAEGQYSFYYAGKNNGSFAPLPSFCPIAPVKVYRWLPTATQIAASKKNNTPLSLFFEQAVKNGDVKISTSSDTCIHKTWAKEKLWNDSAGCQVLTDNSTLTTLGKWAVEHQKKGYENIFYYTLFTQEQFINANR